MALQLSSQASWPPQNPQSVLVEVTAVAEFLPGGAKTTAAEIHECLCGLALPGSSVSATVASDPEEFYLPLITSLLPPYIPF